MKTEIDHLPQLKQDELKQIATVIREKCDDVEMIICFGSYARGDWKDVNDLDPNRKSGHKSDYDILVVTRNKATAHSAGIWHKITKACNDLKQSTHARIIAHDIENLNIRLAEGEYFFTDIKKEGCLLYNSGSFELANERQLTSKEKKRIAQDYFDHWFRRANEFYDDFINNLGLKRYEKAAFELHQATESSFKTVLLVLTGYNPNEHYLGLLGGLAADEDSSFKEVFPRTTKEDQERFRLLDYAYIGGRYDPKYSISKNDLEILAISVKKLIEHTEKVCKQKIKEFADKR